MNPRHIELNNAKPGSEFWNKYSMNMLDMTNLESMIIRSNASPDDVLKTNTGLFYNVNPRFKKLAMIYLEGTIEISTILVLMSNDRIADITFITDTLTEKVKHDS